MEQFSFMSGKKTDWTQFTYIKLDSREIRFAGKSLTLFAIGNQFSILNFLFVLETFRSTIFLVSKKK